MKSKDAVDTSSNTVYPETNQVNTCSCAKKRKSSKSHAKEEGELGKTFLVHLAISQSAS
jgi:hypothetical protein